MVTSPDMLGGGAGTRALGERKDPLVLSELGNAADQLAVPGARLWSRVQMHRRPGPASIAGGTTEINRNIVAEQALGLPR